MILKFDSTIVRIATKAARLKSVCTGCEILPHSVYGLNPLPSRNVLAVQEKQTQEVEATATAQIEAKVGGVQTFESNASFVAKGSGGAARRVERQGAREETISRVVPRPHGSWDLSEPYSFDGCLDGDYLTSRGQHLENPSTDPVDAPLATVQADEAANEIAVELSIEIQPRDLTFYRVTVDGSESSGRPWFQREKINREVIARRLIELTHSGVGSMPKSDEVRITVGRTALRGKRRRHGRKS